MIRIGLFAVLLFLAGLVGNAQGYNSSKIIDDNVIVKKYEDAQSNKTIRYFTVARGYIIRVEDLKLQLFDADFNLIKEHLLDRIPGMIKYNDFDVECNENVIYIMHENKMTLGNGRPAKTAFLYKMNYEGEILKTSNFAELDKLEYSKDMEIIDDQIYVIWQHSPSAKMIKGASNGSLSEYYTFVTKLDSDLQKIETYELPFLVKDLDFNSFWYYDGLVDENFTFRRFYALLPNGKYTNASCSECKSYSELLEISPSFEIVNQKVALKTPWDVHMHYDNFFRYDTTEFKISINGDNFIAGKLPMAMNVSDAQNLPELIIKRGGKESGNILVEFKSKIESAAEYYGFMVHGIISDPINESVVLIGRPGWNYYRDYYFTFDRNLKLVSIHEISPEDQEDYIIGPSANVYSFRYTKIYDKVSLGGDRKANAFDYALENCTRKLCTIINFDEYQFLIVDDLKLNTSTIFKFTP